MTDLREKLREDRELRNAARSIIVDQFLRVREGLSGKQVGEQLADKVSDEFIDAASQPRQLLRTGAPLFSAIAGAAALWFAREPIMRLLTERVVEPDKDEDQDHSNLEDGG